MAKEGTILKIKNKICPYTGLRAFGADEALYFKGRDEHIEKVIQLLQQNKFLMLTGASGDGKSSLVYAGLVPNARAGFFRAKYSNWLIADFRPERKPLDNLANVLSSQFGLQDSGALKGSLGLGYSALVDFYKNTSKYIEKPLTGDKKNNSSGANLMILVDQFEEFFTNPENFFDETPSNDAKLVVNLLCETHKIAVAQNLPIYIICTMRSDFIGNCSAFRGLPELIGHSHYFVPRLNRNEMFQVIDEPALLSGNKITPRLVERILFDLKEGLDVLPVLQHALFRIWEEANNDGSDAMDLIHYAKVGGMDRNELAGVDQRIFDNWHNSLPDFKKNLLLTPNLENVLNTHADELFETMHDLINKDLPVADHLTQAETKYIIKTIFTCLTKIDENREVRNRMSVQEIMDMIENPKIKQLHIIKIVDIYRSPGNTLIRPYIPSPTKSSLFEWLKIELTPESVLDITHEALIRNWDRLLLWARQEYDGVNIFNEYQQQLKRWVENARTREYLLSAGQLSYFKTWYDRHNPTIGWIHRYKQYSNGGVLKIGAISEKKKTELLAVHIKEYLEHSQKYLNQKKKFVVTALVTTSLLLVLSVIGFFNAQIQKNKAEQTAKIAKSNEIAFRSFIEVEKDPTIAFRLAEEAYNFFPGSLAKQALMASYTEAGEYYQTLTKHESIVLDAEFSKDGNYILTTGDDYTAKLLDLKGTIITEFGGKDISKYRSYFSPDGNTVLTYSNKEDFFPLWDLKGNILQEFKGHTGTINNVEFTNDSKHLISCSKDGTAKLWNLDGKLINEFSFSDAVLFQARLSPDMNQLILRYENGKVFLINLNGNKSKMELKALKGDVHYVKWSPNGKYFILVAGNSFYTYNTNGKLISSFIAGNGKIDYVEITKDGNLILVRTSDNLVLLYSIIGEEKLRISFNYKINFIEFTPDGRLFITVGEGSEAILRNLNGNILKVMKVNDFFYSGRFSPDQKYMLTTHNHGQVNLWHMKNYKTILYGHNEVIWDIRLSEDGNKIISSANDNSAIIWDFAGNQLVKLDNNADVVRGIIVENKNRIIISTKEYAIKIFDLKGKLIKQLDNMYCFNIALNNEHELFGAYDTKTYDLIIYDMDGNIYKVLKGHSKNISIYIFTRNNKYAISASYDNTAIIWDVEKGVVLQTLSGHSNTVYRIALSPDDKYIATASYDGLAIIWDMNGDKIAECKGHTSGLADINFSNDGTNILTASLDNTARLWDLKGNEKVRYVGHTSMVNTAIFSNDDKYVLTSSDDGTARLWTKDGTELSVYKGHKAAVQKAIFTKDGDKVLTASLDGTIRIWPLFAEEILTKINTEKERGEVYQLSKEEKKAFGIIN